MPTGLGLSRATVRRAGSRDHLWEEKFINMGESGSPLARRLAQVERDTCPAQPQA